MAKDAGMSNHSFNTIAQFQQQARRFLPLIVAAFFLLLIFQQLWSVYTSLIFQPKIEAPHPQTVTKSQQKYSSTTINDANLFGITTASTTKVPVNKKLPTTNQQLILRGAFSSTNDQQSSAMIEDANGITRSYRLNAKINANTRLHSIFNNRVILFYNGQLETLRFPTFKDSQNVDASNATSNSAVNGNQRNSFTVSRVSQNKTVDTSTMTAEQRQQLIKSRLQELRKRSRSKG